MWDYDTGCLNNDFMGYALISIYEMIEKYLKKESIPLLPGKPGHKWGGELFVDDIEVADKESTYYKVVISWIRTQNTRIAEPRMNI